MSETFALPDVGEGLTEAEIVNWLVKPGDTVEINQTVVEIETAKSVVELPVPYAGVIEQLHAEVGDVVEVGEPLVTVAAAAAVSEPVVETEARESPQVPAEDNAPDQAHPSGAPQGHAQGSRHPGSAPKPAEEGGAMLVGYGASKRPRSRRAQRHATHSTSQHTQTDAHTGGSAAEGRPAHGGDAQPGRYPQAGRLTMPAIARPPIRKLAKDLRVTLADIAGSGPGGEVTRQDVVAHAEQISVFRNIETPEWPAGREQVVPVSGAADAVSAPAGGAVPTAARPSAPAARDQGAATRAAGPNEVADRDEVVKVHGVRRSIAKAMVSSAFTAPHVTVFVDVDATRTMEYVRRLKNSTAFAGVKVSPLLIMAKAVVWAAQRNPEVNSSFDDERITIHHYVNLGIAAATPRGLLVPNIKEAQSLSLRELAQALGDLTATARAGRTPPAAMRDGTITITNIGVFGVDAGTPILNPGEVAIVAMGAIRQKPWVVDGEVRPRFVTTVSASFDHRCVDGDVASRFTADVASVLEEPALLLDI